MATDNSLSLTGLNKAAVLAVLYNRAKPQGMGFMHYDPTPMTTEEAQKILDGGEKYFDYLKGRVMKVDLSGDTLNPWGYDRDNGPGAAEKAIAEVRRGETNSSAIRQAHSENTRASVAETRKHLHERSIFAKAGKAGALRLGLDEFKGTLGPKLNKAIGHQNQ